MIPCSWAVVSERPATRCSVSIFSFPYPPINFSPFRSLLALSRKAHPNVAHTHTAYFYRISRKTPPKMANTSYHTVGLAHGTTYDVTTSKNPNGVFPVPFGILQLVCLYSRYVWFSPASQTPDLLQINVTHLLSSTDRDILRRGLFRFKNKQRRKHVG